DEAVAQRAHPPVLGVGAARAPSAMVQDNDERHPAPPRDQQDGRIREAGDDPDQAASARPEVDDVGCTDNPFTHTCRTRAARECDLGARCHIPWRFPSFYRWVLPGTPDATAADR